MNLILTVKHRKSTLMIETNQAIDLPELVRRVTGEELQISQFGFRPQNVCTFNTSHPLILRP